MLDSVYDDTKLQWQQRKLLTLLEFSEWEKKGMIYIMQDDVIQQLQCH